MHSNWIRLHQRQLKYFRSRNNISLVPGRSFRALNTAKSSGLLPGKIWNTWKAKWKHSYFTFGFAGNGLEPKQNVQDFVCNFPGYSSLRYESMAFYMCSKIRLWHHAKWQKQNGRKVWFKVQSLGIWYPTEKLLHFYKACLLKLRETIPVGQMKQIFPLPFCHDLLTPTLWRLTMATGCIHCLFFDRPH